MTNVVQLVPCPCIMKRKYKQLSFNLSVIIKIFLFIRLINQQSNEPEIIPHRNFPAALGILEATSDAISLTTNSNSSTPLHKIPTSLDRSNFRQQPPPMKVCLVHCTIEYFHSKRNFSDLSILSTTNSS